MLGMCESELKQLCAGHRGRLQAYIGPQGVRSFLPLSTITLTVPGIRRRTPVRLGQPLVRLDLLSKACLL